MKYIWHYQQVISSYSVPSSSLSRDNNIQFITLRGLLEIYFSTKIESTQG